ncbi:MAG: 4Fe-4S dicluster domain-containing protein [Ignavibacteria bacterium]|nr:4Fe-4S dicluster domain-containing protein [Ignavibacteria bacterium]
MSLIDKIQAAGIVGAGGGGFPAHVKAQAKVEFIIANGAECEPLIHKDFELMLHFPAEVVGGMKLVMDATGAQKGYLGVKAKNKQAIEALEKYLPGTGIEMVILGDFYPAGDEYELVYLATGRLIPPAGIPLNVGCVVNNVETFYNIYQAARGSAVTRKFVCVAGAVKKASSFFVPVGTTFRELIEFAGGTTVNDFGIFIGGLMMGSLTFDLDEVVTKTTSGLIVLPKDHYLVGRKNRSAHNKLKIGKSACDQCSYCTEMCPRYLLGYDVQPHKVMRSLGFTTGGKAVWNQFAELCCACGLCTLYSCPEDLYPKEACDNSKQEMKSANFKYKQEKPVKVHPIKEGRRVPLRQLRHRLQVENYEKHAPYLEAMPEVQSVKIMLKQHVGDKALPIVSMGDSVKEGTLIAKPAEGKLGSYIHSSIDGKVTHIAEDYIKISR